MGEAAFHAWLCDALSRVKLEDEAYVGYVESILKEDTYQPDGDIVLTENLCDVQDTTDVEQNDNVSKIVQESQAQREKAREKHQQKVLREKELLLKDQEKKEKRKRKTEKREKRR